MASKNGYGCFHSFSKRQLPLPWPLGRSTGGLQLHKHLHAVIALGAVWALAGCSCGKGEAFSQFASPAEGALVRGAPIEISGTATAKDSKLAKVEVSTDDGATWADASGTSTWTYAWAGAADG